MIILDTNVLSELMRPQPSQAVSSWVALRRPSEMYTTAISPAEILHGINLLPPGRRQKALAQAAQRVFDEDFRDRILAFDSESATAYATLSASRQKGGRPISMADAQIAAIALSNACTLATRNTDDFELCGIVVVNPWGV